MSHKSQSARRAAFIETLAASKPGLWLRAMADLLARRITDALVVFGEFIYPDFFETQGREIDSFTPAGSRYRERGSDDFKRSPDDYKRAQSFPPYAAAYYRAGARRRRLR